MPDDVGLLSVDPVAALGVKRQVEVEDDSGHDETHLGVGKAVWNASVLGRVTNNHVGRVGKDSLLSNAVSGTGAEGLHGIEHVGLVLGVTQPTFGSEFHGVGPVLVPVVNGPLEDGDNGLFRVSTCSSILRIRGGNIARENSGSRESTHIFG